MEGHDNKDNDSIEQQQYPEQEKKSKGKRRIIIPLVISFIIVFIIGVIILPYILDVTTEDPPIYRQYTDFEGKDRIVYKNEKLNVIITKTYNNLNEEYEYSASWFDIEGDEYNIWEYRSKGSLYHAILKYAEELSENQLKWFDYMYYNVIT
jgi:hypothetical protein